MLRQEQIKLAGEKHILGRIFEALVLIVMFYNSSSEYQSDQLIKNLYLVIQLWRKS